MAFTGGMQLTFSGEIFTWRGPAPFHFVAVPTDESDAIAEIAQAVTYGWGVIPVQVTLGATSWETSLFPKDGGYLVPIKDMVRRAEDLAEGDVVDLRLAIATP